jgi:hypothetical protein
MTYLRKLDGGVRVGVAYGGVDCQRYSVAFFEKAVDLLQEGEWFRLPSDAVFDVLQRFLGREFRLFAREKT